MTTRKELLSIKGISEGKVDKIFEAASKIESATYMTALELQEKRMATFRVSTGSDTLNNMLQGGIESMSITEVHGEFRTGKSQLCMTMCVTAQLEQERGGSPGGKVCYIDTEGTFRPERIRAIAIRFEVDPEEILSNIYVARAYTVEHQSQLLMFIAAKMAEERFTLLIIDSIMALFRVDYSGRGELSERQNVLGKFLSRVMKLAEQFNLSVFITNQVMADPGGAVSFVPDPKKPIGGHILAHAATTRLSLRKGRGETRLCKIIDSPCLPEMEVAFQIGPGGVEDVKE